MKFIRSGCLPALVGLFFVILLVELGLRLLKLPVTFTISSPCLVRADPQFGYGFRPNASGRLQQYNEIDNWITINSLGFHDVEHDLAADQPSIMVLGDSFTAATQVPVASGWTQTVEGKLGDTAVINLGVSGYGTDRQLKVLAHYAPVLKPDAVILAFFENDIQDVLAQVTLDCYDDHLLIYQTETQKQQLITFLNEQKPSPTAYWLAEHFVLYRVMATLFAPSGFLLSGNSISPQNINVPLEPLPEIPPDMMVDLLTQFEALAEEYDFQIFIIPVPGKEDPGRSLALLEAQIGDTSWPHIEVVDVYPTMAKQLQADGRDHSDLYFLYDGHFNSDGYALFGQAVAIALQERWNPDD